VPNLERSGKRPTTLPNPLYMETRWNQPYCQRDRQEVRNHAADLVHNLGLVVSRQPSSPNLPNFPKLMAVVVMVCLVVGKGEAVVARPGTALTPLCAANQQPYPAVVHLVALVAAEAHLPKDLLERPGPAASSLPHDSWCRFPLGHAASSVPLPVSPPLEKEDVWVEEAEHV
jgi:hypothetical protein